MTEKNAKFAVLIVAAGRGTRSGGEIPKQYRRMYGEPVLRHTIRRFTDALPGSRITCVIHKDDQALYENSVENLTVSPPVFGGATRQESVKQGLTVLADKAPEFVLIHDAARPFVSNALIQRVVKAVQDHNSGVIPTLPVTDTIKTVADQQVTTTLDRDTLRAVQTPQAFPFPMIYQAHSQWQEEDATDDASLLETLGYPVFTVDGEDSNIKLTRPRDFEMLEHKSAIPDVRTGTGFDVHRFGSGDHVTLCGVTIPHSHSLQGHSDADVAIHAIVDAIFAAIVDGDIGSHFPPSDASYKGMSSSFFLDCACKRVAELGATITHIGVQIICEAPKIGPHRDSMRHKLSEISGLDQSRISIQATTTEKLGFTGRGEGIAAQASATVVFPGD